MIQKVFRTQKGKFLGKVCPFPPPKLRRIAKVTLQVAAAVVLTECPSWYCTLDLLGDRLGTIEIITADMKLK